MVAESIILIVAIILAVLVFLRFIPLNLWISALASGVHVPHLYAGGHAHPPRHSRPRSSSR